MDASDFLERKRISLQPVYVLHGEEDFLRRRVLQVLIRRVLGESDPDLSLSVYPPDRIDWPSLRSELETIPFLAERRLVVIEQADPFVTENRSSLEKYVAKPSTVGVLVLEVKTWAATTKLAKAVPDEATIACKPMAEYLLPKWCIRWAESEYGKKLIPQAAEFLVELAGKHMGVLDQELCKLAGYVGEAPQITSKDVDLLVGRSRTANVFKIMDAIGNANATLALTVLDELFQDGDEPVAIMGALSYTMRQLVRTARAYDQCKNMDEAMDQAKVPKWAQTREAVRKQLKHLGADRIYQLYDWLLEIDDGLKGGSPLPVRLQVERLLIKMARSKT